MTKGSINVYKLICEIKGYEKAYGYKIYEDGRIISDRRMKNYEIKQYENHKGYLTTDVKPYKSVSVHRLVAKAFIDNPENKEQVNHKDGNKKNNHISNLEWVTCSENIKHAFDNGLHQGNRKEKNYQWNGEHSNCKSIDMYDLDGNFLKSFKSIAIASRETGISKSCVSKCANGNSLMTKGFKFKFKGDV